MRSASEKIFNRILLALPHAVREEVLHQCDRVELASGQVIYTGGAVVEYAYFINTGLVSLVKRMEDGRSVEIAAIGTEGLLGLFAAYGFDRALVDHIVQVPVLALRISRRALQKAISKHEALRRVMTRYLLLVAEQLAQVSACNRLHSLEQRCCQWLLVAHDNALSDQFQLTHEFLASLLGAQRPSVSTTTNRLQKGGLIRYSHGKISILDRAALEETACECYRARCNQIDQAIGASKTSV
ncbi:MAG: Crp/Fnr family transcriptional regulator [Xanthobacteraceae bacterium]